MLTYRFDMADAADLPELPRPSQLWKQLNAEKKRQAADAFWHDEHAANEQAEAINMIAQRIKFRLKSVLALPLEKKSHYLLGMPAVSEMLAARLLVAYHLQHQRAMMGTFLDALGIRHEEGIIAEDEVKLPCGRIFRLDASGDTRVVEVAGQDGLDRRAARREQLPLLGGRVCLRPRECQAD